MPHFQPVSASYCTDFHLHKLIHTILNPVDEFNVGSGAGRNKRVAP